MIRAALAALLLASCVAQVGESERPRYEVDIMARRPGSRIDRRAAPGGGGGGGAAAYPTPNWRLRSDDASFSGGKVTSIAAQIGPNAVADGSLGPLQNGPSLNGHASIIFSTSGSRLLSAGTVVSGSSNADTASFIVWCENDVGVGDREYFLYFKNGSTSSTDHLVYAQQANILGWNQYGIFDGAWNGLTYRPRFRPVVLTYRRNGTARDVFVNGTNVGTTTGANTTVSYADANIGASYEDGVPAITQYVKCAWWGQDFWKTALSDAQIAAHAAELVSTYAINTSEYLPSDNASSLTMWLDSRGKQDVTGTIEWPGTATLSQWDDQSGNNHYVSQGTGGLRPAEGARINGRSTVGMGSSAWMAGSSVQGTLTAASGAEYAVHMIIQPHTVTSTQATAVDRRDCFIGDAGDYWSGFVFNDSGTLKVGVYHYGGATYQLSDSGIALDTPTLVSIYYASSVLYLRVGNRTPVSVASANLGPATAVRIGWSWASAAKFDGPVGEVIFRNSANSTVMTNDRAYLGTSWNVAYQ